MNSDRSPIYIDTFAECFVPAGSSICQELYSLVQINRQIQCVTLFWAKLLLAKFIALLVDDRVANRCPRNHHPPSLPAHK